MRKSHSEVLLLLFLQVARNCGNVVEWMCGEEGLYANGDFDVINEKLERDHAVRRIEEKIHGLHQLVEQISWDSLEVIEEKPQYEHQDLAMPYHQPPVLTSNQPAASRKRLRTPAPRPRAAPPQAHPEKADNLRLQLQPFPSYIQSQRNSPYNSRYLSESQFFYQEPKHFTPREQPEPKIFTPPKQLDTLAPNASPRRLSIENKASKTHLSSLQPQTSSFQPKVVSSQPSFQLVNNSFAKQSPEKKMQLFKNRQWASRWYHPVFAGNLRIQLPRYCNKLYNEGTRGDGIYDVIANGNRIEVFCEFEKNGHNWLVFQRREDGSIDFYKNWTQYDSGFGSKTGEFWLGLSNLYELTRVGSYVLRVDLEDFEGARVFAEYSTFAIESPSYNFRLCVGGYKGNSGDALTYHNGFPFSTYDRDHDNHYRGRNCAEDDHGAWWYNSCQHSNLNGEYLPRGTINIRGIVWYQWKHSHYSMRSVTMKFRPT